ncbi:RNA-binding protein, putative [Plasmodium sp. gorilla clade G2]|uniref:RNA-binding protein, putative n=1 Tax=Plasmodium sp. gorilla clade G2 TaxID=880535 RepID=UPI000D217388|nr:RNA-binding protein, putative [Plasmodium sp. gorilla clade G2]SOV17056.1 RNA-binding protein, putative [Plasmodium sp. gorilla clade G2]
MNKNTLSNNIHDKSYKYSKNRQASNDEMAYITNEEINMNNSHVVKEKSGDCNKDGTIFKLVDKNNNDMLLKDETKEYTPKSSNKDTVFLGEKGNRYLENTITNRIDIPLNRKNISSINNNNNKNKNNNNNNNNNSNNDSINFKNKVDNNSNIYNTAIYTNYDNIGCTRDDIYNNNCINNIDNAKSRDNNNYIKSNKIIKRKKNKIMYYNNTHNNRAITQKGYDVQETCNSLDIIDKNKTEGVYNNDESNMECIENKLEDVYNNSNIWDKVNVSLSNCKLSEGENEKRSEEFYLNNFVSDKNDMNNTWDINNMNNNMMYSNNLGCEEKNYHVAKENYKRWTDEYNIDEMFIKKNDFENINPEIMISNYKNNNIHKTSENIENIKNNNNYINDRGTINGDNLKKPTNDNMYHNEYNKNKNDDNTKYKNNRNYRNKYMNKKNNKNKTKNNANNKSECINDGTNCSLYDSINSYNINNNNNNINNNNNNNVENVTNIFKNTPFSHITMNENNIREDTSNIHVHTNKYRLMQKNVNEIINFNISKNNSTNENNNLVDNMNDNLKEKNDMPDDIDKFLFNQNDNISVDGSKYMMNNIEKSKTFIEGEKEINDVIEHISEKENMDTNKKYSNKKKNHVPNLNNTFNTLKNNIYHSVDQKDEEKLGSNIINNTNSDINNNKMNANGNTKGNNNINDNGNILSVHISQHNNLINNMNSIVSNEYTYMNEKKDENNKVPYNFQMRNIEDISSCRNNINDINLFGNKTYINVPNNMVTKMFNDTNRSTNNNMNNMNSASQIYENAPSFNTSLVVTKSNMQDNINNNMNIIHNNNNNNGAHFFNGVNNSVHVNYTNNTSNEKDAFNSSVSKKNLNENMSIERPVILNNSQMLEAFIQGRLCLSCDSLDHPMPLCPNNSFVCPNCHNVSHRGNDCPMKCRFCLKYHMGISIMDCLKKARIQTEKNNSNNDKKDNHNNNCSSSSTNNNMNKMNKNSKSNDEKVNIGPRFDISTRPDNSYGRSVYVSNLSEDISNIQLRDTINLHLDNGFVVNIDRQDGYAFVELSNLYSTFQLVQKTVSINFKKLKIQFKKTGQFLIPDNLSQSFGNMKNFNMNINMNNMNTMNNINNMNNMNNVNNINNINNNIHNDNNIVEYNNKKSLIGPSNTLSKNIPNHMINKNLSNKGTTFINIPTNRSRQYNNRNANNKGNMGANKQYNNKNNNNNNNKKKTNTNMNTNHNNKSNQINNIINNNNININNINNNINNNNNINFNQFCNNNIMSAESSNITKFTNSHSFNADTFLEGKNKNIYKSSHLKCSKNTSYFLNNQQKQFHTTELQKIHQNSIEPSEEVKKNESKENIKKNFTCSNSFGNEMNKYHIAQKENNKILAENNYQKNRNSYNVNTIILDQNKTCQGNNLFGSLEYKINMENKNIFSNECNISYDNNFIYNYNFPNDNKVAYKCSTYNNYNITNNFNNNNNNNNIGYQNYYGTTYNHGLPKVNENNDNSSSDIPFKNHDNKMINDYMNSNTNTTASGFCPNNLFTTNDISNKLMNQEVNIYMNISNKDNGQINKNMRNETNKTMETITTSSDNIMNASFFNTMFYVKEDYVEKCDEGNHTINWIGYTGNGINNNNNNDNINIMNSKNNMNNMNNMNNIIYKTPQRNYMNNNDIDVNSLNTFPHENKNISPKYMNEKENDEFEYNTHLNIKSILDDAIEINQNTIDYDQYNYYDNITNCNNNNNNNIDKYTIQNDVDQTTVTNYNTSNYNIQMKEENNYKENDLLYYNNCDKTNNKNEESIYINKNIWKDKIDNSYNICNDMFFGNNDIYDIFSNFNSIKLYENNMVNDNTIEKIGKHVNIDNIMNETITDHIENDGTIDPIENDITIDHTHNNNNGDDNHIEYNDSYIFKNNIRLNNTRLNNDTFQNVEDWNKNKLSDILKNNENIMFHDNKDMTNENVQNQKDIDDLEILNIPYMKNMKDKELDAIEQDLERHIKALWNIRKIKIVKSYDIQK